MYLYWIACKLGELLKWKPKTEEEVAIRLVQSFFILFFAAFFILAILSIF